MLKNTQPKELAEAILAAKPELSAANAERLARRLTEETDARLEENVREWLEFLPVTPIVIGDYSLPLIMQIRGNGDFIGALLAMNDYLADPVLGARKIWRRRL